VVIPISLHLGIGKQITKSESIINIRADVGVQKEFDFGHAQIPIGINYYETEKGKATRRFDLRKSSIFQLKVFFAKVQEIKATEKIEQK
jgi:hypothetical protein